MTAHTPGAINKLAITGSLIQREALRYTPANVAVVEFRLAHVSRQIEANVERTVQCEMAVKAIGVQAHEVSLIPLNSRVYLEGFLAARSARHAALVLHMNKIELIEGMEDGFQTETS